MFLIQGNTDVVLVSGDDIVLMTQYFLEYCLFLHKMVHRRHLIHKP